VRVRVRVRVRVYDQLAGIELRDVAHSGELLAPITLGCKTKIAKIVGISIAALQRLVALGGVPTVRRESTRVGPQTEP
jgi:hypothetical protein